MPRHWRSFSTPAGSNVPTLRVGDYLMANTSAFVPKRGDMIVFARGGNPADLWIKRIIGMPGETVQMIGGRLYIDRQMVPREPIEKFSTEDRFGHIVDVPTYRETLPGGVSHTIIEIEGDTGFLDDTQAVVVPPGNATATITAAAGTRIMERLPGPRTAP